MFKHLTKNVSEVLDFTIDTVITGYLKLPAQRNFNQHRSQTRKDEVKINMIFSTTQNNLFEIISFQRDFLNIAYWSTVDSLNAFAQFYLYLYNVNVRNFGR